VSHSKFDSVAREYDAGRPGYPDALFDAVEDLAGTFFHGARVADIAAGTGKATRAMQARGAHVFAADHGKNMLEVLRSRTPDTPILLADANALPFANAVADLVTFAQAWHWVDLDRAPAEVVRVVRPGGAIALWWNVADRPHAESWLVQHRARYESLAHNDVGTKFEASWQAIPVVFAEFDVETTQVAWQRSVSREVILDELRSKSYIFQLGAEGMRDYVENERRLLPQGELHESFLTRLAVVRIPA